MKMTSLFLMAFVIQLGQVSSCWARMLTAEDLGYRLTSNVAIIQLQKDGTGTMDQKLDYQITTSNGIEALKSFRIPFSLNTEKISNLLISTESEGKTTTATDKNIEEKSLESSVSGFDDSKVIDVATQALQIGAKITERYRVTKIKADLPGYVNMRLNFNSVAITEQLRWKVEIPENAQFLIHDEAKRLTVQKTGGKGGRVILDISGQNIPGETVRDELSVAGIERDLAWIEVTTFKSFEQLGSVAKAGFDRVLAQPLPPRLQKLFTVGTNPKNDLSKIDAYREILKKISDEFHYFGDWRASGSGYVPRDLVVIASSSYGDCKDFSVLATLAARSLGLKAEAVLVVRGDYPDVFTSLPSAAHFNHAISRVRVPGTSEKYEWVDATNPIPNLGVVPSDIASRPALVLEDVPQLNDIPAATSASGKFVAQMTFDLRKSPSLGISLRGTRSGLNAWSNQMYQHGQSAKTIDENLLDAWKINTQNARVIRSTLTNDTDNHLLQTYSLDVEEQDALQHADGRVYVLPLKEVGVEKFVYDLRTEDRFSDLALGFPDSGEQIQDIKAGTYKKIIAYPRACHVKSPWLDFDRIVHKGRAVSVVDHTIQYVSKITRENFSSAEFRAFQKRLKDCIANQVFLIQN